MNERVEVLTRREQFAMAAIAGFSANPNMDIQPPEKIALWAVVQADALIAELDKQVSE